MPTDSVKLAATLEHRSLALTGAFVPVALKDAEAHAAGVDTAVRTAALLADTSQRLGTTMRPFLVLADENGSVAERTLNAGRISPGMGLSDAAWDIFCAGANRIAQAVLSDTGLKTVFHHHCAGYVETHEEIARLLAGTDPALLSLVFDTGHYAYAAGTCAAIPNALAEFGSRIEYVHFKDQEPNVAQRAREEQWDYFAAVRNGVFCELGKGCVDFPSLLQWLQDRKYVGFVTVEQDVLPGMGSPRESAQRNRDYLRSIGL
jgi:inosose dehydratase